MDSITIKSFWTNPYALWQVIFSDKLVCGNICNVYEVFDDVAASVYLKNHDYLGNLKLHLGKSKITFADWSTREN